MRVLGIESSCDETAASVVEEGRVLSDVVASQTAAHKPFGGVVPEIASRQHMAAVIPVIREALAKANTSVSDLDGVVATSGPGLKGALLVGLQCAKSLAATASLPFVGVNHLKGHLLSARIEDEGQPRPDFPFMALQASGGHTGIYHVKSEDDITCLGATRDDAAGEAFDKVGRLLGLPYPGGPAIEKTAREGNPEAFKFPRAWLGDSYDFSFSGLKTAVLRVVEKYSDPPQGRRLADLAASFQAAVVDVLSAKAVQAAEEFGATAILLCGGVSANRSLRAIAAERAEVPVHHTPPILCTDNAAMVGACAHQRFIAGERSGWDLDVVPSLRLV
jgi:N6-L-threonylcarbamoyladenine synthase